MFWQRRTDTTYGCPVVGRRELEHRQKKHRDKVSSIKSQIDTRPPAPMPHLTLYGRDYVSKKKATTEAAFSDLKMIQSIARTMTRRAELPERKGPLSLNAGARKQEIYGIMQENHRLLNSLEALEPVVNTKDLLRQSKFRQRYIINASHSKRLSGEYDSDIEQIHTTAQAKMDVYRQSVEFRRSQRMSSSGSQSMPSLMASTDPGMMAMPATPLQKKKGTKPRSKPTTSAVKMDTLAPEVNDEKPSVRFDNPQQPGSDTRPPIRSGTRKPDPIGEDEDQGAADVDGTIAEGHLPPVTEDPSAEEGGSVDQHQYGPYDDEGNSSFEDEPSPHRSPKADGSRSSGSPRRSPQRSPQSRGYSDESPRRSRGSSYDDASGRSSGNSGYGDESSRRSPENSGYMDESSRRSRENSGYMDESSRRSPGGPRGVNRSDTFEEDEKASEGSRRTPGSQNRGSSGSDEFEQSAPAQEPGGTPKSAAPSGPASPKRGSQSDDEEFEEDYGDDFADESGLSPSRNQSTEVSKRPEDSVLDRHEEEGGDSFEESATFENSRG